MKWMAILSLAFLAMASGCEGDDQSDNAGGALSGTSWRLDGWSASSLRPDQFNITAEFSASSISGRSAVNSYGASYTAESDGSFSVGAINATRMAGTEETMRAESIYFDLLAQARGYSLSGSTLMLKNSANQELLIFRAKNSQLLEFTGTVKWQPIETGFYSIDADDGKKYEPLNLPSGLQVDGLRVRVTAKARPDMASVNMYGTIIQIESITKL